MFRLHIQVRSIDCADQIPPEELGAAITQHWDIGSRIAWFGCKGYEICEMGINTLSTIWLINW